MMSRLRELAALACVALVILGRDAVAAPAQPPGASGPTPVLEDSFDHVSELAAAGWTVEASAQQSLWRVRDGRLEAVCRRNPYKGGRIVKPAALLDRGVLEFDAKFATSGGSDYGHLSLGFKLYGRMTAFKKYGGHKWMAYHPPPRNTWTILSNAVPLNRWVHFKLVFDCPAKRAEYYWGDMDNPVYVEDRFELPEAPPEELEFFNYGLCNGTVTHQVDNVRLCGPAPGEGPDGAAARDRLLLFRGISYERCRIEECLASALPPECVSVYTVETRGAAVMPRNRFALDRVPSAKHLRQAARIVLVDVPTGPAGCLPPHLLNDLHAAVRGGAEMLVLGGMFAFGKGLYAGTPLAEMLPVNLPGVWDVKRFAAPRPIEAVAGDWPDGPDGGRPAVLFHHEAPPRDEAARILLRAGGKPMLVTRACGAGKVTAFLGTVCGDFPPGAGVVPFWEWEGWPAWVRKMLNIDALVASGKP